MIFDGMELALSSICLSERRESELFKKIYDEYSDCTMWSIVTSDDRTSLTNRYKLRPSRVMGERETPLKLKIFSPESKGLFWAEDSETSRSAPEDGALSASEGKDSGDFSSDSIPSYP